VIGALLLALGLPAQAPKPDPAVLAAELSEHVRVLASDEFEGRATGSPGAVRAAQYLAAVLEASGAEPAGDPDAGGRRTFLQDARIERTIWRAAPRVALVTQKGERVEAGWGTDFEIDDARSFEGRIELIVGSASGARLAADAAARGVIWEGGTRSQREAWLSEQGRPQGQGLDALVLIGGRKPGSPRTQLPSPRMALAGAGEARAPILVRLRGELGARAAAGEFGALELALELQQERQEAANVVARLPARGARVLPVAIVISAHYDHLGRMETRTEDAAKGKSEPASAGAPAPDVIRNGADDDASGCAAVLELVGALAARPERARELVVLLATGEEIGLLGTEQYLRAPVVPLEATACNLNFEMIGRPDALVGGSGALWLTGFERSNLGAAWSEAGLRIARDPRPEQRFFQRSDNYAFARRGIVAQTLSSYDLHGDYHTVRDEWSTLDYAHMEQAVRVSLEALTTLIDGTLEPSWLPGGNPAVRASEAAPMRESQPVR